MKKKAKKKTAKKKNRTPIFRGEYSRDMWDEINNAKTIRDCRYAMYTIGCRLQELEHELFD